MARSNQNHLSDEERRKPEMQQENEFKNQARRPDEQNRLKDQENKRK
ncbi:hypothetical protein [Pseudobacillus badius]|nr:hypothetical protein [Bacillus badius]